MGVVVKPHSFSNGSTILASEHNANFDVLYNLVNGNIESANLANGAVGENQLASSAVTDAKVSSSAAIALSKLAALSARRAAVTDASGELSASSVTSTELGYLNGVTSPVQTQLGGANLLTQIKTVDGAGSGLDADTVDGKQASAFVESGGQAQKVYAGVADPIGSDEELPAGWSSSGAGAEITVTHNLGTSNYTIVATNHGSANPVAFVDSKGSNSFSVETRDLSGSGGSANVAVEFILILW